MIRELVDIYITHKKELEKQFAKDEPTHYRDIVEKVFKLLAKHYPKEFYYKAPDWKNIHEINDGDYQGTLLYLVPFDTYQPREDKYYYVAVNYGSCSVCDTLSAIQGMEMVEDRVKDYLKLCLHIIQGIKVLK